jgi:hypothetical protein
LSVVVYWVYHGLTKMEDDVAHWSSLCEGYRTHELDAASRRERENDRDVLSGGKKRGGGA